MLHVRLVLLLAIRRAERFKQIAELGRVDRTGCARVDLVERRNRILTFFRDLVIIYFVVVVGLRNKRVVPRNEASSA